jgi:hypothetical protein
MPDNMRPFSEVLGGALAEVVIMHGGPANPDDLDRDIYQETIDATEIDPKAEWRWVTCER